MIKPAQEGSSIGMARPTTPPSCPQAWRAAAEYDAAVLAERWLPGAEFTCAILDGRALPLIRLETPNAFYDYEAKYHADSTRYHCPCGLPAERGRAAALCCAPSTPSVPAAGAGWTSCSTPTARRSCWRSTPCRA
jgi:D-alanine-D-alanine ligase